MSFQFKKSESPKHALRRIAVETLDGALASIDTARDDPSTIHGAVHDVRKACKRLRALLRLFRPGLGETYAIENAAARDASRLLSRHRDRRVMRDTCDKLIDDAAEPAGSMFAAVRDRLFSPAAETEAVVLADLDEVSGRLRAIRERCDGWKCRKPRRAAAEGAARVYGEGRSALRDCQPDGPAEAWHDWRKRVKHHGYQARLFKKLHPVVAAYPKPLKRLGEVLGEEHDLSVLIQRLADADPQRGGPPEDLRLLASAAEDRRRGLREAAAELGAPLFRLPPKSVKRVVRALLA